MYVHYDAIALAVLTSCSWWAVQFGKKGSEQESSRSGAGSL